MLEGSNKLADAASSAGKSLTPVTNSAIDFRHLLERSMSSSLRSSSPLSSFKTLSMTNMGLYQQNLRRKGIPGQQLRASSSPTSLSNGIQKGASAARGKAYGMNNDDRTFPSNSNKNNQKAKCSSTCSPSPTTKNDYWMGIGSDDKERNILNDDSHREKNPWPMTEWPCVVSVICDQLRSREAHVKRYQHNNQNNDNGNTATNGSMIRINNFAMERSTSLHNGINILTHREILENDQLEGDRHIIGHVNLAAKHASTLITKSPSSHPPLPTTSRKRQQERHQKNSSFQSLTHNKTDMGNFRLKRHSSASKIDHLQNGNTSKSYHHQMHEAKSNHNILEHLPSVYHVSQVGARTWMVLILKEKNCNDKNSSSSRLLGNSSGDDHTNDKRGLTDSDIYAFLNIAVSKLHENRFFCKDAIRYAKKEAHKQIAVENATNFHGSTKDISMVTDSHLWENENNKSNSGTSIGSEKCSSSGGGNSMWLDIERQVKEMLGLKPHNHPMLSSPSNTSINRHYPKDSISDDADCSQRGIKKGLLSSIGIPFFGEREDAALIFFLGPELAIKFLETCVDDS